jgi:hypothetical protein
MAQVADPTERVSTNQNLPHGQPLFSQDFKLGFKNSKCLNLRKIISFYPLIQKLQLICPWIPKNV